MLGGGMVMCLLSILFARLFARQFGSHEGTKQNKEVA